MRITPSLSVLPLDELCKAGSGHELFRAADNDTLWAVDALYSYVFPSPNSGSAVRKLLADGEEAVTREDLLAVQELIDALKEVVRLFQNAFRQGTFFFDEESERIVDQGGQVVNPKTVLEVIFANQAIATDVLVNSTIKANIARWIAGKLRAVSAPMEYKDKLDYPNSKDLGFLIRLSFPHHGSRAT